MHIQKGFIQVPILIAIIAGILVLVSGGYFGIKQYQNYQTEKVEQERTIQEEKKMARIEAEAKQKALEETQQQKDLEVEELRREVEALKNKPPQIIVKETEPKEPQVIIKEVPQEKPLTIDLPTLIGEWRPMVAYISCEWRYSDTADAYHWQGGSGILINMTDIEDGSMLVVLTNKHVILKDDQYTPRLCDISLPGMSNTFRVIDEGGVFYPFRKSNKGLDWGLIRFQFPNDYMKSLAASGFSVCKELASVGEEIVILGYPGIGSQADITATEGIISGYDGNHYITSAKVERGNSGGAAILQKNNCYLGIPTFAEVGDIESLARILDINAILHKQ